MVLQTSFSSTHPALTRTNHAERSFKKFVNVSNQREYPQHPDAPSWAAQVFLFLSTPRGTTVRISGILYMHRISDNRMVNDPIRNLARFESLCGKKSFHKVILITTMWDEMENMGGVHVEREKELEDNYWKTMLLMNSRMIRYENTPVSAWGIIDCLL